MKKSKTSDFENLGINFKTLRVREYYFVSSEVEGFTLIKFYFAQTDENDYFFREFKKFYRDLTGNADWFFFKSVGCNILEDKNEKGNKTIFALILKIYLPQVTEWIKEYK